MLQVFINGPPGVGKTTLCKLLCAELELAPVSTGDLLKENISQRTELGCIAKQYIASKALVPDHVVVDMVAEKVLDCSLRDQGWVLDGFPRTVDQCSALRRKMISPTVVIILELPERECTKRITGRRFDGVTGNIYHLPNVTPRDPAVLARLTKRGDDTSEKLPPRFEAYHTYGEKTNALFSSVSHRIDASASPEELLEDVLTLLHSIRPGGSSTSSINSNSLSGAMTEMTVQGNQPSQQQSFGILNPLPAPRSTITQYQQQQPKKQIVPQKIEEEEEDEDSSGDALDDMQEYNYDCDDDNGPATKKQSQEPHRVSPHVSQKRAVSESSASSSSAASNASNNNNNEELPPSSVPVVVAATNALASSPSAAALLPSSGVDMVKFKDMLLDGFEVFKHGRRGSPHARLIFTDMDFKRIFWQKVTKETSGGGRTKKAKLDQSLVLADVVQVVRGMKTEVLKRTGDVSKYERYLSLVADDRTLDMELPSDAACDFLLHGFDMLLHGGGR